jgi:ADP-ribosylglycohydrolase
MPRQQRYMDYFRGCFVGVAIGDAMGAPVETMTHEAIMQLNGGKGVTEYMDQVILRFDDKVLMPARTTSDDWQLTSSLARAIIASEGLDLKAIARDLVTEFRSNKFGWGGTLKSSTEGLEAWFATGGKEGRSPMHYLTKVPPVDPKKHCGNGVAMRIAPYALWHGTVGHRIDELVDQVFMIGRMTHDDPRASIAAVAVAAAIAHLLYHGYLPDRHGWFFKKSVMDAVRHAEEKFAAGQRVFSQYLEHAYALTGSPTLLREEIKCGSYVLESVPFAIATFLRHPNDFRAGVLEAVNAGGDADTTAAMVGAMIGVNVGISGIPADLRIPLPDAPEAARLATELHDMCVRTAHPHR